MKKQIMTLMFTGLLLLCNSTYGQTPPLFYDLSTGPGTPGSLDPNWLINSKPGIIAAGGQWYQNNSCGEWISNSSGGVLYNSVGGNYTFSTSFTASNLVSQCPHDAFLDLTFIGADDYVSSMTFNGTSLTSSLPASTSFNNPGSMYVPVTVNPGLNTLSLTVYNVNSTPLALQICGGVHVIFEDLDEADQPSIGVEANCVNGSATLSVVSGSLNDADMWNWYSGGCNGTLVGVGPSITVTPSTTTTYFVNGIGNCVDDGPCGSITVDPVLSGWQQYTESDIIVNKDNIFDVITDLDGNVFVAGKFVDETVLNGGVVTPNLILQDAQLIQSSTSFIAKYDPCGELLWAAHSSDALEAVTGDDAPSNIALDENNNLVYIAGSYTGDLIFNSSNICGSGGSLSLSGNPVFPSKSFGYVAAFDMTSGCIRFLEDPFNNTNDLTCTAIAINESNGDVFVGGGHTVSNGNITSVIRKFPFSGGTTLGTYSDNIHVFSNSVVIPGGYNSNPIKQAIVNDMDFNETNNMLYFVGTLGNPDVLEFTQFNQSTGPVTNTYVGMPIISMSNTYPGSNPPLQIDINSEAYIMAFSDGGSPTIPLSFESMKRGGSVKDMSANAVSVDNNSGEVYIVGEYRLDGWQTASNGIPAFTFGGPGSLLTYKWLPNTANSPSAGGGGAYLVKLDWQLENGWATYTSTLNGNGYTEATGVSAKNGRAYISGIFLGDDITFDPNAGIPSMPYLIGTASTGGINPILSSRAFAACYNSNGTGVWANATTLSNPSIQNGHHYAYAIAADNQGNAFIVGMYNENLDYFYSAVPTAALNSNYSSPQLPRNGFVLRLQDNNFRPNGSFSRKKETQIKPIDAISSEISIYPNPATDILKVQLPNQGNYQMNIYDLTGKMILEQNVSVESGQTLELDLQELSNGTYVIKCVGKEIIKSERLIITNK